MPFFHQALQRREPFPTVASCEYSPTAWLVAQVSIRYSYGRSNSSIVELRLLAALMPVTGDCFSLWIVMLLSPAEPI